jgi:antitoxin FitA
MKRRHFNKILAAKSKRYHIGTVNLSLKEVPATTHRTLKERAEANHRSLNGEILAILESAVSSTRIDASEISRRAAVLRTKFKGVISEADLNEAKRKGRS